MKMTEGYKSVKGLVTFQTTSKKLDDFNSTRYLYLFGCILRCFSANYESIFLCNNSYFWYSRLNVSIIHLIKIDLSFFLTSTKNIPIFIPYFFLDDKSQFLYKKII